MVSEERDNHQLDKELLSNRLRHLEGELETSKNSYNEKTREIRILEVRCISQDKKKHRWSQDNVENILFTPTLIVTLNDHI